MKKLIVLSLAFLSACASAPKKQVNCMTQPLPNGAVMTYCSPKIICQTLVNGDETMTLCGVPAPEPKQPPQEAETK